MIRPILPPLSEVAEPEEEFPAAEDVAFPQPAKQQTEATAATTVIKNLDLPFIWLPLFCTNAKIEKEGFLNAKIKPLQKMILIRSVEFAVQRRYFPPIRAIIRMSLT
jgi:hypothetical protein